MPRKIKPRKIPGYEYTGPTLRRNVNVQNKENQAVNQAENQAENQVENLVENQVENPAENQVSPPIQENPAPSSPPPTPPKSPPPSPQEPPRESPAEPPNLDNLLSEIYKSKESPAAYSAAVKKYIDTNYSLSLHKQRRKRFRRRPFVVYDPYDSIQADLVFYNSSEYYTQNSYYKYILCVIDMFSKKAYAEPLKTKSSLEVGTALDKIILSMPITPRKLMVDAGTEFSGASNTIYNIIVRKYKVGITFVNRGNNFDLRWLFMF